MLDLFLPDLLAVCVDGVSGAPAASLPIKVVMVARGGVEEPPWSDVAAAWMGGTPLLERDPSGRTEVDRTRTSCWVAPVPSRGGMVMAEVELPATPTWLTELLLAWDQLSGTDDDDVATTAVGETTIARTRSSNALTPCPQRAPHTPRLMAAGWPDIPPPARSWKVPVRREGSKSKTVTW